MYHPNKSSLNFLFFLFHAFKLNFILILLSSTFCNARLVLNKKHINRQKITNKALGSFFSYFAVFFLNLDLLCSSLKRKALCPHTVTTPK